MNSIFLIMFEKANVHFPSCEMYGMAIINASLCIVSVVSRGACEEVAQRRIANRCHHLLYVCQRLLSGNNMVKRGEIVGK